MKRPEDIEPALIEVARAAANAVPLTQNLSDEALRAILAVAWDEIFAHGYTDGFQDQEGLEIQGEMLKTGGWAPRMFIWMDGATQEQAEEVLDKVGDFAHEIEPEGVTFTVSAIVAPGKPHFATRDVGTD